MIYYHMESLGRNISALTVTSVFYKSSLTPLLRLNKEVTYCPDHLLRFHPRNAPSSSPDTGGNSWFCQDCRGGIPVVTGPWLGHFITVNHSLVGDNTITGRSPFLLPQHLQLPGKVETLQCSKYIIQLALHTLLFVQTAHDVVTRAVWPPGVELWSS